jgi:AraC family transcriptional regulator
VPPNLSIPAMLAAFDGAVHYVDFGPLGTQSLVPNLVASSDALTKVLAHEFSRSDEEPSQKSPVSRGGLATWQSRVVIQHIEEHLSEQISLVTLADLARVSQSHFSRAFKQSFGVPPHEYHVQRRIDKAKALLAEREASVTDVGFALGYSHTSSFSVAFRKITGRSPRDFRRDFARP